MKQISILIITAAAVCAALISCEKADSEKSWGTPVIYMPQANYKPYTVPNKGSAEQSNLNYSIDEERRLLNVFLGVYRSGLQELKEYSVEIASEKIKLDGAQELPPAYYELPSSITCTAGKRDVGFCLSVDLDFLISNSKKNWSLGVYIFNPKGYELNPDLTMTTVRINTAELIAKEGLE